MGLLVAAALCCPPVFAEESGAPHSEARALGLSGIEAYQAGDFAAATTQLEESFRLLQIPTLGLWSARALTQMGLLVEAAERYRLVPGLPVDIGDSEKQLAARAAAEAERAQLLPRIPTLSVRIVGAKPEEVRFLVDGEEIGARRLLEGLPLNPGRHELTGQVAQERSTNTLSLVERQREEITLRFSPPPVNAAPLSLPNASRAPAPPEPRAQNADEDGRRFWRTSGWISLGVGAAGLATGVVAYLIGRPKRDAIDENPSCRNDVCGAEASKQVDSYNPIATVNLVGLVTAGVFGVAGATVLILTPPAAEDVALQVGPGSLELRARF